MDSILKISDGGLFTGLGRTTTVTTLIFQLSFKKISLRTYSEKCVKIEQ
jgi:hypothetical protein